ncbi:hypothetical protein FQY66_003229 [Escherichia coli]|nr:hypothetical protein [Escherichia coli]EGO5098796.1 hypothetical protein [Escherichia coli]EME6660446.1 hypothetical protein [Escherichia coli]
MSGTSGSSSDAALATRYAAEYFCKTWTAPGLNQAEGYKAISDLSHHYFRAEGSSPRYFIRTPYNGVLASQTRHDYCPQSSMIRGVMSPGLVGRW